jgi:hypothetical protein
MNKFDPMRPLVSYADIIEEVFGIKGVMALAWYSLLPFRFMCERMGFKVPLLIIEGLAGTGKTELAQSIVAIDVPEGIRPGACIRNFPNTPPEIVEQLMRGKADLVVLEELKGGIPNKSIMSILLRDSRSPMLMMTSKEYNGNSIIADECIFIRTVAKDYTIQERRLLENLHKEMKMAWNIKPYLYRQNDFSTDDWIRSWRRWMIEKLKKDGYIINSVRSLTLIDYYALILGRWQGMAYSDKERLYRLAYYSYDCLTYRIPKEGEAQKTFLERKSEEDGTITVVWHLPDGQKQRIVFNDVILFRSFVHMIREMNENNTRKEYVFV